MEAVKNVILAKRRGGAAIGGHPWVFPASIARVEGNPSDGDEVAVIGGDDGRFIAYGLFNSQSEIRVRLYSWDAGMPLTDRFFESRIRSAVELRESLPGYADRRGAARLVFSESDGLSGLVADRYADHLVVQITSLGLLRRFETFSRVLWEAVRPRSISLRGVKGMAEKEGIDARDRLVRGEPPAGPVPILEEGVEFEVRIGEGQKTGFYLDQRENRAVVGRLSGGKRVLDLYTYTGGFALHCARGGAKEVVGVDSSAEAIRQARRHADLNRTSNATFVEQDVLEFLHAWEGDPFDLVVLDPPKLAPTRGAKERGFRMYHRVNADAMKLLRPGGILVSCSCSGAVESDEWITVLHSAARRLNRWFQVLEVRGAGRDHPFSAHCPESRYLKCVIGRLF